MTTNTPQPNDSDCKDCNGTGERRGGVDGLCWPCEGTGKVTTPPPDNQGITPPHLQDFGNQPNDSELDELTSILTTFAGLLNHKSLEARRIAYNGAETALLNWRNTHTAKVLEDLEKESKPYWIFATCEDAVPLAAIKAKREELTNDT